MKNISSKFSEKTIWVELYCLLIKLLWKDNMDWVLVLFDKINFLQTIYVKLYWLLIRIFLKGNLSHESFDQIIPNLGWKVLSFAQNFFNRQYGLNCTVVWSKFSKKTIWIEPHFLLIKIFHEDYMGWNILSFCQNFLKGLYCLSCYCLSINIFIKNNMGSTVLSFDQNVLKRQYEL